jgi:gamma-glutamyltranspeptidase/glutathione hydrolase/leukotriene-C4 hydrolase
MNAASGSFGIVAADDPRCSAIGADALSKGGNAVDAAIAASLCLGVVSPASSGLGGGAFLLFYNSSDRASAFYDGREVAPQKAYRDMFLKDPKAAQSGGLAIAVPGQLRALRLAWERHGSMPWYDIVMPSAELAKSFCVSSTLARHISAVKATIMSDAKYGELRSFLMGPYGRLATIRRG